MKIHLADTDFHRQRLACQAYRRDCRHRRSLHDPPHPPSPGHQRRACRSAKIPPRGRKAHIYGVRRGPCNDRRRECDKSGRIRRRERSPASRGLHPRRTRPSRRPRRAAPRPYSRNPVLARPSSIPAPRSGCKRNVRLRRMRRGVNPSPSPSPPSFRLSAAGIHPAA